MTWRQSPSIATVETILLHVLIFIGTGMAIKYCGELDLGGVSWVYRIYYDYASRTMNGEVPYRDFLVEYPVLSFPLFALPRLLFADFRLYCIAFAAEMLLFDIAAIILIARYIAMHEGVEFVFKRLMWYSVYSACLSILVVGRFELAPMVLAFAASSWLFRGRNALGGFVAGLGTLTKLFPCLIMGPCSSGSCHASMHPARGASLLSPSRSFWVSGPGTLSRGQECWTLFDITPSAAWRSDRSMPESSFSWEKSRGLMSLSHVSIKRSK